MLVPIKPLNLSHYNHLAPRDGWPGTGSPLLSNTPNTSKKWIVGEKATVCFREKSRFTRSGFALCPFSQRSRRFGLEKPYHQTNHEISTHFFIFGSSAPLIADLLLACSLPCNLIKTLWDSGGDMVEGTDQFVVFFPHLASWLFSAPPPQHGGFFLYHLLPPYFTQINLQEFCYRFQEEPNFSSGNPGRHQPRAAKSSCPPVAGQRRMTYS